MPDWQDLANQQIGKPYIWGSQSGAGGRGTNDIDPTTGQPRGFDCSGFVSWVMKNGMGIDMPAFTGTAYTNTRALNSDEQPQTGDVVFYNMNQNDPHTQHMALYLGNGKIIEAGGTGKGVNIADVNAVGTPTFHRANGLQNPIANGFAQADVASALNKSTTPAPFSPSINPYGLYGGSGLTDTSTQQQPAQAQSNTGKDYGNQWANRAAEVARQLNIPEDVFVGLVKQESGFDPNAHNPSGASGLTQLMPDTAKGLGVSNPFDPEQALQGGAKYLKQMLDMFGGDAKLALAAYNAGPGNVQKYGGIPPFAETQKYVNTILSGLGNAPNQNTVAAPVVNMGSQVYTQGPFGLYPGNQSNQAAPSPPTVDNSLNPFGLFTRYQ